MGMCGGVSGDGSEDGLGTRGVWDDELEVCGRWVLECVWGVGLFFAVCCFAPAPAAARVTVEADDTCGRTAAANIVGDSKAVTLLAVDIDRLESGACAQA